MLEFFRTVLACNRRGSVLLPLLLATTVGAGSSMLGQSISAGPNETSSFIYHSSGSEVRLVIFATDEHHHAIQELQKDDFAVVDDENVIRQFRSFTPSVPLNLNVVVLIDASESVLPRFEQEVTDIFQMLSQWPWAPGDELSVMTFSGQEVQLICAGKCQGSLTLDQIAAVPKGGATPLYDAVEAAADLLMQRKQADVWPLIILFSDGQDTISKGSFTDASEKVFASEAQLYAVDFGRGRPDNGTAILQTLADNSGGRYAQIRNASPEVLTHVRNNVLEDLHSARLITYALPESGLNFHSVRVLPTHNLAWRFRCRRGYYEHWVGGH